MRWNVIVLKIKIDALINNSRTIILIHQTVFNVLWQNQILLYSKFVKLTIILLEVGMKIYSIIHFINILRLYYAQ